MVSRTPGQDSNFRDWFTRVRGISAGILTPEATPTPFNRSTRQDQDQVGPLACFSSQSVLNMDCSTSVRAHRSIRTFRITINLSPPMLLTITLSPPLWTRLMTRPRLPPKNPLTSGLGPPLKIPLTDNLSLIPKTQCLGRENPPLILERIDLPNCLATSRKSHSLIPLNF